jgi:hypothetical protein
MAEMIEQQGYGGGQFFADFNTRLRDLEEKQRLARDRVLLISESFVKDRDRHFEEVQEMKKELEILKAENKRMKDMILRISEGVDNFARKEELMILQRQFNLFRGE